MAAVSELCFYGDSDIVEGLLQPLHLHYFLLHNLINDNIFYIYFYTYEDTVQALALLQHIFPPLFYDLF